ncbi:MAG: Rrf2 family transcriptional regulator [Actinobacteria bacterium]|nr:Rrf2 family transcriptional regulator [Actinomycetota bacterium]
MKLSTRSTYGVRAMLVLALRERSGPVMSRTIAEEQGLPINYLEQLMSQLRKANLVTALRGPRGGFVLARPASDITIAEIVEALEGPLTLADCPSGPGCCGEPEACAVTEVWEKATEALSGALRRISLAALADRAREKASSTALTYNI